MRMSYGDISRIGRVENPGSGDWASQRKLKADGYEELAGFYTITFDPPFRDTPVVVVSGIDDADNITSVHKITRNGFDVQTRQVKRSDVDTLPFLEDGSVSFVSLSPSE